MIKNKKKVAIIGGGIFGVSSALELAGDFEVVIFEQESDVMSKGTYANQYRHHYGFHYPRSRETVRQCLDAQDSFRSRWQGAIIDDIASYYAVAKVGSRVTADEFIKFCDEMGLKYKLGYPDTDWLNRDAVDVCVFTREPIYDIYKLKSLAKEMLAKSDSTKLRLSSKVIGAKFDDMTGQKILTILHNGRQIDEVFDYVINATYANQNLLKNWLGFPSLEIEFRLKEVPIVKLPTNRRQAITIMDGPFVTIVPIGNTGLYTFGDVARSVREIKFSTDGVPWTEAYIKSLPSRFLEMKEANPYYIPIIAKAQYLSSMFAVLPILPDSNETDARLTAVTEHGRGCWSVFEGKIVTAVGAARAVAKQIRNFKQ